MTGCARSGTTYAARLLTACGVRCGHEDVFRAATRKPDAVVKETGATGDSSCFAAPLLPRSGVVVVHLVRPPLDTVASLAGRELLTDRYSFYPFKARHAPAVTRHEPGVARAAVYWLAWNELAASVADLTWRLHDLDVDDVTRLSKVAGLELDPSRVAAAVSSTPRDVNHHPRPDVALSDLGELAEPVQAAAVVHGVPLTMNGDRDGASPG